MKNYELTYLISPGLSEQEVKNVSDKVSGFIKQEEGILEKRTEPTKRKLGYPIREKNEALLVSLDFSLTPEKLTSLEKTLKSENQILRYVIIIKKKIKEISKKRTKPQIELKPDQPETDQPRGEKVELKEIDKKIEEILRE